MEEPSVDDFDNPEDVRAHVFVHYVKIAGILCDLSHAVARRGSASLQERDILIRRLLEYERRVAIGPEASPSRRVTETVQLRLGSAAHTIFDSNSDLVSAAFNLRFNVHERSKCGSGKPEFPHIPGYSAKGRDSCPEFGILISYAGLRHPPPIMSEGGGTQSGS